MKAEPFVRLGDVCEQDRSVVKPGDGANLPYIGLESIEANTGTFHDGELSKTPDAPQANSFGFGPHHVLYGKLRPYLNKVALPDFAGKCSTEIIPLRPREGLDRRYLAYFLRSPATVSRISARTAGARMPRADMDFVFGMQMPLPTLDEQRRIIDILSRAEGILRLRREAQKKAAQLVPAIFLEKFGDPATNPKGWPKAPLSNVANVISGVAKGRRIPPGDRIEVPYMRVANVKDGYLDLGDVKTIEIRRDELEKLRVEPGDLLMTEGGDPDKLGRAALWSGELPVCVHQNHVFKVRADRSRLVPTYLRALAGSHYGKGYFARVAKRTTGIASISKTQLSEFPALVPPTELQTEFEIIASAVGGMEEESKLATRKAQEALNAMLSKYFPERSA